ncbi:MAG: hypothetical protein NTX09_01520 [Verrucomicrobia bacterium]|nr:hypothetical protein [Verrucomicrobiota bacterium]
MPAAPTSLAALRHLLAERFPTLPKSAGRVLPTGIAGLDAATGGLPLGAITEIVCQTPSCAANSSSANSSPAPAPRPSASP